jgi:transcriptional regulator with XRE-family HTH domain
MGKNAMKILADNLNRLIGPGKKFASNEAAAAASGVGRSTIDRARRAEVSLKIDNVAELARAFGVEPWELLYPNLNAEHRPSVGAKPQEWPLPGVSPDDFRLIPQDEREEVVALVKSKVTRHRSNHEKSPSPKRAA